MENKELIKWNSFVEPRPYIGVIGFAFNSEGKFPILHRSDKVRSAKNAWSLVSGLHEVGKTVFEQFADEAREECHIHVSGEGTKIGFYDAILPEDKWHWVMVIVAMRVLSFASFENMEPDKHDAIEFITIDELYSCCINWTWTPGTKEALLQYHDTIIKAIKL